MRMRWRSGRALRRRRRRLLLRRLFALRRRGAAFGPAALGVRSSCGGRGLLQDAHDIEVVFLYPWAVAFTDLSFGSFLAMGIFILLLAESLIYLWIKGVLTWK